MFGEMTGPPIPRFWRRESTAGSECPFQQSVAVGNAANASRAFAGMRVSSIRSLHA
ncbi:hypothetical protein H2202_009019 [Exophiala xenobiotica]|nr:hypothetical protein H2202_009019 [Exophiala xenobiotica]